MTTFSISNGSGDTIDNPSTAQMSAFLRALDVHDEEHGAAWLATEAEDILEWSVDGRLVYERPEEANVRHLLEVPLERVVELWSALARGDLAEVERCAWNPGNGSVLTPEREAEIRRFNLQRDREFYDVLGAERPAAPCQSEGCTRGAIEHSVLCRVHHFESVQKRPCPFGD